MDSENRLLTLKIAGRFREVPIWATKLPFEIRPNPNFNSRAWKYWKPSLNLMAEIVRSQKIKINARLIHSHFNQRKISTHDSGWWDPDTRNMFLCTFDKETMLHELAHAKSEGFHGDPWARTTAKLFSKYLSGRELNNALINLGEYRSGQRVYKELFGERPPKYKEPKSVWWHLKP